ncbi:MAG: hypothetical protein AAF291_07005 [Pseudomonadota bacterium]
MLEIGGARVALAGFARDAALRPEIEERTPLHLGVSRDAAFLQRAGLAAKNAVFNTEIKDRFADCEIVMARNLEQLAIAARITGERPLVYECLDIHRLLVEDGLAARLVQQLEGALLPRCAALLTSSPAFLRNHFDHRPLQAPTYVIENKLLLDPQDPAPAALETQTAREGPITIGWFGMLRCKRTLAFLEELATAAEGRIEVLVAGKPSPAEVPDLAQRVGAHPHMTFHGSYTYNDLLELYGRCDFAWSVDWFEEGLNSQWLLPNRLYEAITYGCVPIAMRDVEVGKWLKREGAGLIVEDADDAKATLLAMTRSQAAQLRAQAQDIDTSKTTADTAECERLVALLAELTRP